MGMDDFEGKRRNSKVQGYSAVSCVKPAALINMLFGVWNWVGPRNHVSDGVQIPSRRGNFEAGLRLH